MNFIQPSSFSRHTACGIEPLEHRIAPAVTIAITDGTSSVLPGDSLKYTIDYGNDGAVAATGVQITDTLPDGMTFDPALNPDWVRTGSTLTLPLGNLAAGATDSALLILGVAAVAPAGLDVLVNTATIRQDGVPNPITATATDATALDATPDLQVSKTDGTATIASGEVLTYMISYGNAGNQNATGVFLTEELPIGTTFNPVGSAAGWTESSLGSGVYQLTVGPLIGGASGTVAFSVTVDDTVPATQKTVENAVSITDDRSNGSDPTPANNSATDIDTLPEGPDLVLTKTDGATTVTPGGTLTYTLSYSNEGSQDASGVVISDTLPAGTSFDPALNTGWTLTGGVLTFNVGTVVAGGSGTMALVLGVNTTVAAGVESITNTATISDNGASGADATPADNVATDVDTLDAAPDLILTKTDGATTTSRRSTLTYTLGYWNAGTQGASGVTITDTLPTGTSFDPALNPGWTLAGNTVIFSVGTVNAGSNGTATLVLQVNATLPDGLTAIANTASIADNGTSGSDPTPLNNSATDSNALIAVPDLTLVKGDGVTTAAPGATLTYTIGYANVGDVTANGVVITDALPAGMAFDPALNPGWTLSGTALTFTVGSLTAQEDGIATLVLTVATTIPAGLETIVNTAIISADGTAGADANPLNNTVTDTNTLAAAPDLTLTKSDGITATAPGATLTYTLDYTNAGDQNASGVVVTDTLPDGTSFDPALNPGWTLTGSSLTRDIGNLAAGASSSATLTLTVNASIPAGQTTIANTATISDDSTGGSDGNPVDNTATDTNALDVNALGADLSLTITDLDTAVHPGGVTAYTLNYSNTGTQSSSGVVITEQLPSGTTFNAAGSTQGWTEVTPGVYRLNVGTLAGGGTGSAVFAVLATNPAPAGLENVVNSATIAHDGSNGADPNPASNEATDTNTLNATPDLVITKSGAPYAATRNGLVTYMLAYSNSGNQGATGVFITETLPANMTFVSAGSSAGWTETAPGSGIYRFDAGSLSGAASGTVAFQVRVAATLPDRLLQIVNTATIADDTTNGSDPTAMNNSATLSMPVYQGIYVAALGRSDALGSIVPNAGSQVKVYDVATGAVRLDFMAYESDAKRGVHVAAGDFNGDGFDDIVTSYGTAGGRVRIFDGLTGARLSIGGLSEFNPFSGGKNYGAFVAVGDVTGDGRADIITSEAGHGDRVVVYNGLSGQVVSTFRPFGDVSSGVRVAVGDTNEDGRADIITSHRTGSGQVKVFSGASLPSGGGDNPLLSFDTGISGGVFVGAGNVAGDARDEILIGGAQGSLESIDIHSGNNGARLRSADVFGTSPAFGIRVASVDIDLDGIAEIIAAPGQGGNGEIRFVNGRNGEELKEFRVRPFQSFSQVAVRVAGTDSVPSALVTV